MQSQQKRLKWSRGETSEALEERTDTGITQASVEFMQNCIPDVYGNISRRPALKVLPGAGRDNTIIKYGFTYDKYLQVIPFYISEDDFILVGIHFRGSPEMIRITKQDFDGQYWIQGYYMINGLSYPQTGTEIGLIAGVYTYRPVSYAQQNNLLIIADGYNIYKIQISLSQPDTGAFTATCDIFKFSAGFYAPSGTTTASVTNVDVPNLLLSGSFSNYTYTDGAGVSTVFSQTTTNVNSSDLSTLLTNIPLGSIVQMPNAGCFLRVEGYYEYGGKINVYGSLLTPVADSSASDFILNVEKGYVPLIPSSWALTGSYPHPKKVCFYDQRLWAGAWAFTVKQEYCLTIGSQIAKYNDWANNYNLDNEAITLDMLTQYKERILHLIDYNGLKVFTDSHEYAYQNGGIVTQSATGSYENCEPLVFGSMCLYCDQSGSQIRAMQYQFQNNIYDSNIINQIAPRDLIWKPLGLSSYEDKVNNTGKYLFVVNQDDSESPKLAVCNFEPSNQVNIWSRWNFSTADLGGNPHVYKNILHGIVNTKKEPIFLIYATQYTVPSASTSVNDTRIIPTVLDFNQNADCESDLCTYNSKNYFALKTYWGSGLEKMLGFSNMDVNVYSNGVFQFTDTTNNYGQLTKSLEGLTNVTIGLAINSIIRSHPIDVGGKTKSEKKRIGKAQMSVHDTEPGAITLNGKTGYMNQEKDHICFYGVSGMKDEVKYVITNNNGAMFHLESLLMNIEYGTLDS